MSTTLPQTVVNPLEKLLFEWTLERVKKTSRPDRPLIVGLNGPQGCGKSTVTRALVAKFSEVGLKAVALSIDDFYLTRDEQIKLAQAHPANILLQQRGYPGTHDISLGVRILSDLKNMNNHPASVPLPVYDKSKHQGQGDRLPESEWKTVAPPLDLVFLEGWMLGFTATQSTQNEKSEFIGIRQSDLLTIDEMLKPYKSWYAFLDAFIQLIPKEISYVIQWRIEAEQKMKAQGRPGMSEDEITAYVKKFIPAYELYLPQLIHSPPFGVSKKETLQVVLGEDRIPIQVINENERSLKKWP